jgi:SpoIIAA-like
MSKSITRHGLSIGLERTGRELYLALKATGKLAHSDYELITPMIDSALEGVRSPRIRAFLDMSELEGWEPRAAWDDFKLGMKHGHEFTKIAILGHKRWLQLSAKVGAWFVSGEVRYFEDEDAALTWLDE